MRELRQRRFPLILTDNEAEAVAEYRWRNRIASQTEAVRQLIAKGLESEKAEGTAIPSASN
jgi:hypothetical protein